MKKIGPSKDYILNLLSYDKETGQFTWLESRGPVKCGDRAGSLQASRGRTYIQIRIDNDSYKAHHLAWLFIHGKWPVFNIDHRDGDGTNNRPYNIRECTLSQNKANSKRYKNNRSGHKGIFKVGDRWKVSIQKNGKRIYLGTWGTLEEASAAYGRGAKELFGEFARPE